MRKQIKRLGIIICSILLILNTVSCTNENMEGVSSFREVSVVPDEYVEIIATYKAIAEAVIDGTLEEALNEDKFPSPNPQKAYEWNCMLVELNIWSYSDFEKTRDVFGYALKDINDGGEQELILMLKDGTVLAVFSVSDGTANLLDAYWSRHRCELLVSGELYTTSSGGADCFEYAVQKVSEDGSALSYILQFGSEEGEYYTVEKQDETYINKTEFDKLLASYSRAIDEFDNGLAYIPLFAETEIYEDKDKMSGRDIIIRYPYLANETSKINDLIRTFAIEEWKTSGASTDGLSLDIDYDIVTYSDDMFSVVFKGYLNVVGAAHPMHLCYALVLDLQNERIMVLNDFIDEAEVLDAIKQGKYEIIYGSLKTYSKEEMYEQYSDGFSHVYFYIEDGDVYIVEPDLPYVLGNYSIISI